MTLKQQERHSQPQSQHGNEHEHPQQTKHKLQPNQTKPTLGVVRRGTNTKQPTIHTTLAATYCENQ